MRMVLNVSAVLLCGVLAGVAGLTEAAPSHAASVAVASPPIADSNDLVMVKRGSGSVEAHFEAANTTHDGHLTRTQAEQADWPRVAKHFDEIDTDHKGWVMVEQIHAYNKAHARHRKDVAAA